MPAQCLKGQKMTIIRHYLMESRDGEGQVLATALSGLAKAIVPLPGLEKIEILGDMEDPNSFAFVEYWESKEVHQSAGKALPKEAFAPVMAVLRVPPEGRYLMLTDTIEPATSASTT